jgi:hypothetical protein
MQIGFQFVGANPGVPMRLLQDAGAVDLPIEGASSIPFPQSVASTITLRIWVRIRFAPLAVLLSYAEAVFPVAGLCTVLSTNDHAKGYWPTYAF